MPQEKKTIKEETALPEIAMEQMELAYRILCLALIQTNAGELTYTLNNFSGKGKDYGDFEIKVRRLSTSEVEEAPR